MPPLASPNSGRGLDLGDNSPLPAPLAVGDRSSVRTSGLVGRPVESNGSGGVGSATSEEGEETQAGRATNTDPESTSETERSNSSDLTDEELQEIRELRAQDRAVRRHELAHIAAGGPYTRGASYTYTIGPDGRQYAVSGEVRIDTSPAATPEQTLAKAQVIRRAALAPLEPSAQDRAVAARAAQLEVQARQEINQTNREEVQESRETDGELEATDRTRSDFEFTPIGPSDTSEGRQVGIDSNAVRENLNRILSPQTQQEVGQLIDLVG